jgi:hypothetical protein
LLFVGGQSDTHAQILVVKHFVCPEGTFDVLLRVRLDLTTFATAGTWSVLGGAGADAYTNLYGSGRLTGENLGDTISTSTRARCTSTGDEGATRPCAVQPIRYYL